MADKIQRDNTVIKLVDVGKGVRPASASGYYSSNNDLQAG